MTRFIRYPFHNLSEERTTGAVHAAEAAVIASLDRFKAPEEELLLYPVLLCSFLLCPLCPL